MSQLGPDLGKKWRVFRPKKRVFCPPQRQIRGRLRYKKPPDKAWISSGRTITRAIIRLSGCAMRVLAPLVTKNAARADAKLELPRSQNREHCRCLRNQHARSRSLRWVNTPSTFIGTTVIAAAFIRGNSCAGSVRAANAGKRQPERNRRSAVGVQPATARFISLMKAATAFLLPVVVNDLYWPNAEADRRAPRSAAIARSSHHAANSERETASLRLRSVD